MTSTEQFPAPVTRTSIARPWLVRMVLIAVALWAFGGWAVYDAMVAYPRRGRLHADALKLEYLEAARSAGRLFETSVLDPRGDLATLTQLKVTETSELDRAKREWLLALSVPGLGMLDAEHTTISNPEQELTRLQEFFDKRRAPSALNRYDILMQWLICAVCWGIGAYMLVLFAMVKSRTYTWDPDTRALTLPGGEKIAPADLDPEEPADLSKWHKYIVFLRPRPGHERLRGDFKLDLFRYQPLEDWVRVLVKGADPDFEFPDEKKAREEAELAAAEAEAAPAEEPKDGTTSAVSGEG